MFLICLLFLNILYVNSNYLKSKNTVTLTPYNSFKSYDSFKSYNLTQNKSLSYNFGYNYNLK